jgi:hypothetical protein
MSALSKPDQLRVQQLGLHIYRVANLTKNTAYTITSNSGQLVCNCPSRRSCKHLAAVEEYQTMQANNVVPLEKQSQNKGFRRPISEILSDLNKPIPQRFLATRKQGGTTLTYIPWINVVRLLDYYAPGWEGGVVQMHTTGDRIFITYRLTIHAQEGSFSREATGTEVLKEVSAKTGEIKELAYGDPSSNSESMAFRRAAAKFGLALHLYDKD